MEEHVLGRLAVYEHESLEERCGDAPRVVRGLSDVVAHGQVVRRLLRHLLGGDDPRRIEELHLRIDTDPAKAARDPWTVLRFGLEKILRFNLAWFSYCLDQESACSIRVLSYEALRRNPERGLSQLCSFLVPERKVGERKIQKVIAQTSFERMQAKEKAGAFAKQYSKALTPGDSGNVESFKVRRGKVGGFADYFTGDDLSFADQLMARYDYNQALQRVGTVSLI